MAETDSDDKVDIITPKRMRTKTSDDAVEIYMEDDIGELIVRLPRKQAAWVNRKLNKYLGERA